MMSFDRDRHAAQRKIDIYLFRFFQRRFEIAREIGVDLWIDIFDARLQRLEHFARRHLARAQQTLQVGDVQRRQISRLHSTTLVTMNRLFALRGRVAQRFLRREPIARLIFAEDIEDGNGMRRGFDMADIHFAEFLGIFQNVAELFLKQLRFLGGQIDARQLRNVGHIEFG